jgi:hypothetical protein
MRPQPKETNVKKNLILLGALVALILLPAGAAWADDFSATLSGGGGQGIASIVTGDGQVSYGILTNGIGTPTSAAILQGGSVFVDLAASFSGGSAAGTVNTAANLSAIEANPGAFSVRVQGPGGTIQGPLAGTGGEGPPPPPPPGDDCPAGFFADSGYPDFCFDVAITPLGQAPIDGAREASCIEDTVCVSGALPGRSEVYVRIIGPRPNGFLWPTLVRFTPSQVDVDIFQISTQATQSYTLEAVGPNADELSGFQDRTGFQP